MDNKIMRTNGFGRADNFIIGGIQFSITDIIADGSGENKAVLQHDAHLASE